MMKKKTDHHQVLEMGLGPHVGPSATLQAWPATLVHWHLV